MIRQPFPTSFWRSYKSINTNEDSLIKTSPTPWTNGSKTCSFSFKLSSCNREIVILNAQFLDGSTKSTQKQNQPKTSSWSVLYCASILSVIVACFVLVVLWTNKTLQQTKTWKWRELWHELYNVRNTRGTVNPAKWRSNYIIFSKSSFQNSVILLKNKTSKYNTY